MSGKTQRSNGHGKAHSANKPASKLASKAKEREPKLSEEEILDRTMRLIRADGVESLSMRKLAQALDVAPMSLYHYVRNKDELLARVVDALLARVPTPEAKREVWQDQLREYAMTILEQLSWHPGIARVVVEKPPTIEGRRLLRFAANVLLTAGFDERTAALCLATFNTFLYGVLATQANFPNVSAIVPTEGERSSAARGVNAHLLGFGFREWSQFGVDTLLSALTLQLKTAQTEQRRVRPSQRPAKPARNIVRTRSARAVS